MLLALVCAACGGGRAGGAPADRSGEAARTRQKVDCERTADHLVGLMAPGRKDLPPADAPTALADTIAQALVARCVADTWSADALGCFGQVATLAATSDCAPLLTVAQRESMDRAMEAALGPR